jgi:hypothetical protein
MENNFDSALAIFVANCQDKINSYFKATYEHVAPGTLVVMPGKKYVRIVNQDTVSRSAWAFVDIATGDILKAASWKVPAKHSRGNIYKPESWVAVTAFGPAYLR